MLGNLGQLVVPARPGSTTVNHNWEVTSWTESIWNCTSSAAGVPCNC